MVEEEPDIWTQGTRDQVLESWLLVKKLRTWSMVDGVWKNLTETALSSMWKPFGLGPEQFRPPAPLLTKAGKRKGRGYSRPQSRPGSGTAGLGHRRAVGGQGKKVPPHLTLIEGSKGG